jgi:hypothetical protein
MGHGQDHPDRQDIPAMNAIQQSTGVTMPVGEQIRFLSSRTGAWVLDTYLETAELGNRTIADLLADLFDQNGQLILSGLNNWLGYWQAGYPYRVGDTFKDNVSANAYVALKIHVSSTIEHDMQVGNIDLVVAGVVGPQGPVGPVGPVGPKGPAGETVKVIGSFGLSKTPADLPPNGFIPVDWDGTNRPATAHQFLVGEGMSYSPLSQVDPLYGHLYSYVGIAVSAAGWVDVGSAAGPPGLPGVPGGSYVVVSHLATSPPDVNNPPILPPAGLLVIDLDDNSHGQASIPAGGTTGQFLSKVTDTSYDTFWKTQPIGPPGPTGPQGPVGPQGPQGVPGTDYVDAPLDGKAYGRVNAAWAPVVPITGATMTGPLIVPSNAVTALNPGGLDGFRIDGSAGSGLAMSGQRAGSIRWRLVLGTNVPESGSNTGSDFNVQRYSDAGTQIDVPLSISRATGGMTVTVAGNNLSNMPHLNSAPNIVKGWYGSVNGQERWGVVVGNSTAESGANAGSDFSLNAFSDTSVFLGSVLYVARATGAVSILGYGASGLVAGGVGNATFVLNKKSGAQTNVMVGASMGVARWNMQLGDGNAEGSGNAGSDFRIVRYTDAGAVIDAPIYINRASAAVTLTGTLNGVGAVFSGNVNVGSLTVPVLNTAAINGTTIIASSYLQTSVASGAASLYLSAQANPSGHQYQIYSDTVGNLIFADNTSGGNRFYISPAGQVVATGNMTCSGNFNTNRIDGTIIYASSYLQVASAAPAQLILLAQSVRQWSIRAAGDGFLYFYDDSGGALRFYCETSGRVVFNAGIYSATTLQVIGASTLSGQVNMNALVCTTINTQNNNITMGTGDITCQAITNTGALITSVGGTTAQHQLVNSWRNWSVRCLATSGQFDIADNTAGTQRLVIDLAGTVTIFQSAAVGVNLDVNGVIDVGSTGVGYTGLAATRFAFSNASGTNLTFYTNGTAKGVQTFGSPSDERLKQKIAAPEGDALAQLNALKLISYDVRLTSDVPWAHFGYGFSAQQMRPIIPEAVQEVPIAFRPEDPEKPWTEDELVLTLDLMPLVARLVGAVQQLTRRLETLEGARR